MSPLVGIQTHLPTSFNITGEKGGKEGLKRDSRGDDDETASVTSYESSMASIQRERLKSRALISMVLSLIYFISTPVCL